nr:putative nuclease HARBI1 [Tanacetum cinerariifolium]
MSSDLFFNTFSDDEDEVNNDLAVIAQACQAAYEASKPKIHRTPVERDHYGAHDRLVMAYFSENPQYNQKTFRELRQLAYGCVPDSLDEYLQMGATTTRDSLRIFCKVIMNLYGEEFLRKPTYTDMEKLYAYHNEKHGFSRMLRSIDCTDWSWENCPVVFKAQFCRGDHGPDPFILLKAITFKDLWIWHAFFGVSGMNNDMNVLRQSPIFNDLKSRRALDVPFVANDVPYKRGYYLTDGYIRNGKKLSEHINEFNKLIGDLANIEVDIDDKDQALMLLTSLPSSYDNFMGTLIYGRESLTLEDVLSGLNSRELKKRTDAKDDGDGLYVRGRLDHQDNQGRGSLRLNSKGNKKKSTGFVKKNVGQGSGMHSEGYDNGDFLMAMSEKRACAIKGLRKARVQMKDGSNFVLENVRYIPELKRNLIYLGTLDREGYIVKLQNGRVKVIKGSLMVLSGTMKGNYMYSLDGCAESGKGLHKLERRDVLRNKGLDKLEFCKKYVPGKSTREFNNLCKERGIARHLTFAGTLQQNGLAERMNRTLLNKVKFLLIQYGLLDSFWAEATVPTSYLINRSPSTTLEKKTPIDLWSGHPTNYKMLRIFGCIAHSYMNQGKLKPRAIKCIFLRYPDGVKGYKLWRLDDVKPKIIISRDVMFNESLMYKDTLKGSGAGVADFGKEVEFEVELQGSRVEPTVDSHTRKNLGNEYEEQDEGPQQQNLDNYVLVRDRAKRTNAIPVSLAIRVLIDRPMREKRLATWDGGKTTWGGRVGAMGTIPLCVCTGKAGVRGWVLAGKWVRMVLFDEWVRDMEEEMSSLKKNHTWELVDQPDGKKLVSYKWLYKIKEGIKGIHKPRYKARLVARGFTQRARIHYNEVFSPVVRHTSIRVILSLTTFEDYELEQLDMQTVFVRYMKSIGLSIEISLSP